MIKKLISFFILLSITLPCYTQKILPENLSKKVKLYWDANNRYLHSAGSYYVDENGAQSLEKHGKWMMYSLEGILEEERYFYKNRMHGKQTIYFADKKIKQVYFSKYNVPDSLFKEFDEKGTLIIQGYYLLGSPEGIWQFYYPDSTSFKIERISNDTTYLMNYWEEDSSHTQTVKEGNGFVKTYFSTGKIKESYSFQNGLKNGLFIENLASGRTSISGGFSQGKKNGEWLFFYPNGEIEKRIGYVNDSLEGGYDVFFENGKIETSGQYLNGSKTGNWSWFVNQGNQLDMKGSFEKNKQHGDWEYYYSSGELSYTAHYTDDKKSGQWNYFYKGGQHYRKGDFQDDLKNGYWQTWYEDGTMLMDGNYFLGKEEGEWKNYWENGRLKNQSFFEKGKLHGAWHSYTMEGNLTLFGRYKRNLKIGKWTEFYNNGKQKETINYKIMKVKNKNEDVVAIGLNEVKSMEHGKYVAFSQIDYFQKEVGKYKNGEKHGKWTNYYPGGVVPAVEANYKMGKLDGEFCQYDRRGNKLNEIHYKDGKKHGWFIVYGRDGRPVSEKMFHNGHEMRRTIKGDGFSPN